MLNQTVHKSFFFFSIFFHITELSTIAVDNYKHQKKKKKIKEQNKIGSGNFTQKKKFINSTSIV